MPRDLPWPDAGGDMAARIRVHDWSQTSLGSLDGWPPELRTAVDVVVRARTGMAVGWGPDLILIYNDACRDLIAGEHPLALGRPAREVFHESRTTFAPLFADVMSSGSSAEVRGHRVPADAGGQADDRWFDIDLAPIVRADGSVGGVLLVATATIEPAAHDATGPAGRDREHTEAELRRSDQRYRTVFEAIDEGFCVLEVLFDESGRGIDYRFLETNPAFEQHTGLVGAVGRTIRDLVPDMEPRWPQMYGRVALTGRPERCIEHSEAMGRWFEVGAFRIGRPEDRQVAVLFTDVTARRQAENALQETERKYQELVRRAPAAIYEIDFRQRRFTSVNEAMCRMTGYDPEELLRIDPLDLTDDAGRARFRARIASWLSGEPPDPNTTYAIATKDGRIIDVSLDVTFAVDAEGRPLGATVVAHDITMLKRTQRQLEQAKREAEELAESLEQRVSERTTVAERRAEQLQILTLQLAEAEERERHRIADLLHDDLQQLLTASRFHLSVLRPLVHGHHTGERMLEQADALLQRSIARSRELSHELSPAILHHSGLVAAVQWLAREMRKRQGLRVTVETRNWVPLGSDAVQVFLFRAVQEMLFNVVKHAGVKSAIVQLDGSLGRILVRVQDAGRGFDLAELDRPGHRGMGFGLFSLRERVSYMGGSLEVETAPERGARLTIVLPIGVGGLPLEHVPQELPPAPVGLPAGDHERSAGGAHRILIADDHQVLRHGLVALLEEEPDMVVAGEAANGREAIDLAHKLRPDVILMDVMMPVMDGIEATRRITAELPRVRVIGLSMLEDEEIADQLLHAGAAAYLSKTADSEDLIAAIRDVPHQEESGG
ncbi:MAG: response regulator [Candidatus Krumholzibacteriia bacterium]